MKQEEIDEIIECLPKGKTYFRYFADKYALMLLAWHAREGRPIRQIRQSNFARLLDKEAVRSVLPTLGDGVLKADSLGIWPEMGECYFLTLGQWGYCQVSRRRSFNLVLRLNFSNKHDSPYNQILRPRRRIFECDGHPMHETRHTLSWARIDVDMENGEALIEEVQTDWIRYALYVKGRLQRSKTERGAHAFLKRRYGDDATNSPNRFRWYFRKALNHHVPLWAEAMLSATLWFLRRELGIRRIFYHTFETGNWLKDLRDYKPPRSIYTDLPKQFCFQETYNPPSFIMRSRRKWTVKELEKLKFYVLEV